MGYGDALRDEVHSDSITPLIGIFDMYSASLAATLWWDVRVGLWFRGFLLRAARHWVHRLAGHGRLRAAVAVAFPQQHLLVDIDDGYVDPEVACHVVEHLERIGASGVIRRGAEAATPLWPRHRQADPAY